MREVLIQLLFYARMPFFACSRRKNAVWQLRQTTSPMLVGSFLFEVTLNPSDLQLTNLTLGPSCENNKNENIETTTSHGSGGF